MGRELAELSIEVTIEKCAFVGSDLLLNLTVANKSEVTVLVVDEVRRRLWTPSRRTLELWLCDSGNPSTTGVCQAISVPKTMAVPAGSSRGIELKVPKQLWTLAVSTDGKAQPSVADVSMVAEVIVYVGHARTPFYSAPSTRGAMREQLARWTSVSSVRVEFPGPSQAR